MQQAETRWGAVGGLKACQHRQLARSADGYGAGDGHNTG
jgi:hypothetical protein